MTDIYDRIKEKKNRKSPTWLSYAEEDWLISQYETLRPLLSECLSPVHTAKRHAISSQRRKQLDELIEKVEKELNERTANN